MEINIKENSDLTVPFLRFWQRPWFIWLVPTFVFWMGYMVSRLTYQVPINPMLARYANQISDYAPAYVDYLTNQGPFSGLFELLRFFVPFQPGDAQYYPIMFGTFPIIAVLNYLVVKKFRVRPSVSIALTIFVLIVLSYVGISARAGLQNLGSSGPI